MAQVETTLFEYRLTQLEERVAELVQVEKERAEKREDFLVDRIAGPAFVGFLLIIAQHFWK